jgi:hypothetical protein
MDDHIIQLPVLREHDFHSHVPILGLGIQWIRRTLYGLTAKWPIHVMRAQQDQINQQIARELTESRAREAALQQRVSELEQRQQSTDVMLREFEDRLIDQDRDWAYVTRLVAELDLRLRYDKFSTNTGAGESR